MRFSSRDEEMLISYFSSEKYVCSLKIRVKISPPIILEKREFTLYLDTCENSIESVIKKCLAWLGLPEKRWDETLREKVHVFHTRLLIKNGKVIGNFNSKGLVLNREEDRTVEDDDEFIIFAPAGGG